ncbi:hypothetical protein [Blastococcus sp. TF02-8]|uniref:hypothetical protein n=1 Tax=Blastococcus sp. TF02-8 TaxID=2250574 RepID=UPI0011BEB519|nr:hypothetical protein [Blastococcus sp. TF02-8]
MPELRPEMLSGRGLAAARRMRVRVTPDGAVERTDAAGCVLPVAGPGEVSRILLVGEADSRRLLAVRRFTGPLLVLLGQDGTPLLALTLLDWSPPVWSTGAEWMEVVGVHALARALDRPLEPAESPDLPRLADVKQVLLSPRPPRPWPGRAAVWLCGLALIFGFACLPTLGDPDGVPFVLVAELLVGPIIFSGARARAEALGTGTPPDADGRVVIRPRVERAVHRGLAVAELHIGPSDVVLAVRGQEVWLPGPATGGVTAVVIEPVVVRLVDNAGREYASLATELWAPTHSDREEMARDLRHAGLAVLEAPVSARELVLVGALHEGAIRPWTLASPEERGEISYSVSWLSGVAACLAVIGALGALTWSVPIGLLLLGVSGTVLGLRVHDMVRIALDDRRATRKIVPTAAVRR